jgi:hypothetical protein
MTTKIKTKFGNACLCNDGYYHITSRKEGNNGKKLSRLVFEDFYQIKLPTSVQIHHIDGDRTNDNIWNLIPLSAKEHTTLHNIQDGCTEETKYSISKTKNSTGFFRVVKAKSEDNCMIGHRWIYNVSEDNSKLCLVSASLVDLKEKVLAYGYEWKVVNEELAEVSRNEERDYFKMKLARHSTGINGLSRQKDMSCKQGFVWQYRYRNEKNEVKFMCSVDLNKLKMRVINNGLEWTRVDEGIEKVNDL